jgi:putative replication protein
LKSGRHGRKPKGASAPGNRQAEPAHPVRKDFRPRRHPGAAPQLLLRKLRGVRAGTAPGIQHGKSYAQNFGGGSFASFVFSGSPGTGKNHLAAAIGNHLLAVGHSVLVVTIPDLMLRVRECYDDGQSESSLLNDLCSVDLLVLDEVGIQRGSSGEKVIINQVIDRRLSSMRPVGILTNLNHGELVATLGERVMDRLQMDGGIWVNFGWSSYRKNVSHMRSVK